MAFETAYKQHLKSILNLSFALKLWFVLKYIQRKIFVFIHVLRALRESGLASLTVYMVHFWKDVC